MENMIYAHYIPLTSQGNIYSMALVPILKGYNKLLIASLKREIICFEYAENTSELATSSKEILFTYIPNGAEIISIDAFNKSSQANDIVIGITIIKTDASKESYLNIYSGEDTNEFNIDNISQNCLMIDLNYTPYKLYHTYLPSFHADSFEKEIVWLVSGSDSKVHMYKESTENHTYKEIEIDTSFVEFLGIKSIIIWFDILYFNSMKRRVTAYGCESGDVKISLVNAEDNVVIKTWDIQFVNMISCVKLFTKKTNTDVNIADDNILPEINLIVTNTTLPSVVFTDLLQSDLTKRSILLKSNFYNLQSTVCIADIDLDGENEILIGTYGQELLSYKFDNKLGWKLSEQKSFGNPIYSIQHVDITGDGMRELIVLTLKGVHILQNKPDEIEQQLLQRMEEISIKA